VQQRHVLEKADPGQDPFGRPGGFEWDHSMEIVRDERGGAVSARDGGLNEFSQW